MEQDIFIELAGQLRCSILLKLKEKGKYKQGLLAKDLDMTVQESHRQVERLVNAGLMYRDSGFLCLTSYGSIIVTQLPCFDFLQKHKEYFNDHFTGNIHPKFVERIGELNNCELVEGAYINSEELKSIILEAKDYIHVISAQTPPEAFKLGMSMSKNGVNVSVVLGQNSIVPKKVKEVMMTSSELKGLISRGVWKSRMVESVQVMTVLNEQKGMVLFPNLKGKVDTNYAFFSKDPAFHEWCFDYFIHTWDHAGTHDIYKLP